MYKYKLSKDEIQVKWAYVKGISNCRPIEKSEQSVRNKQLEKLSIAKLKKIVNTISLGDYDQLAALLDDAANWYTRIPENECGMGVFDYWPDRKARVLNCKAVLGKQIATQFEILKADEQVDNFDLYGESIYLQDEYASEYHQLYMLYYPNSDQISISYDLTSDHKLNCIELNVIFRLQNAKLYTFLDEFVIIDGYEEFCEC